MRYLRVSRPNAVSASPTKSSLPQPLVYFCVKFLKRKHDVIELFLRVLVLRLTLFNTGLQVDGFALGLVTKLTRN